MGNLPAWTHSRAAWGAIAIAVAAIAQTVAKLLQSDLDLNGFLQTLLPQFGLAAAIIGLRFKKA